jgi:hypothetical protein
MVLFWARRYDESLQCGSPSPTRHISEFDIAQIYAKIGDKEETINAMRQALKEHFFAMSTLSWAGDNRL